MGISSNIYIIIELLRWFVGRFSLFGNWGSWAAEGRGGWIVLLLDWGQLTGVPQRRLRWAVWIEVFNLTDRSMIDSRVLFDWWIVFESNLIKSTHNIYLLLTLRSRRFHLIPFQLIFLLNPSIYLTSVERLNHRDRAGLIGTSCPGAWLESHTFRQRLFPDHGWTLLSNHFPLFRFFKVSAFNNIDRLGANFESSCPFVWLRVKWPVIFKFCFKLVAESVSIVIRLIFIDWLAHFFAVWSSTDNDVLSNHLYTCWHIPWKFIEYLLSANG